MLPNFARVTFARYREINGHFSSGKFIDGKHFKNSKITILFNGINLEPFMIYIICICMNNT